MNECRYTRSSKGKRTLAFLFFLCALGAPSVGVAQPEPEVVEPEEADSTEAKPPASKEADASGDETQDEGEEEEGDGAEAKADEGAEEPVEPAKTPDAPVKTTTTTEFESDVVESETPKPTTTTTTSKVAPAKPAQPATTTPDKTEGDDASVGDQLTTALEDEDKKELSSEYGNITSTFTFGSYGRVRAATDFDGGTARQINVVSHGSRIDESNYAELEFQNLFELPTAERQKYYTQVVATLALGDNLFHFTGDFDQTIAVRNLYADAGWKLDALTVSFWGGSRMYRGDDIYLLDFWPLDNLNTVGGGGVVAYDLKGIGRSELKLHGGASRLFNPYQFQVVQVPGFDFGASDVVFLNRQRTILTARLQQDIWITKRPDGSPKSGAKVVLYGEDHSLPEGTRRETDSTDVEYLPAEDGRRLGAELGVWTANGFFKGSFANLFYVNGTDLAAYGEFGIPSGVSPNETSEGARMRMFAASANLETPYAGLLLGSYYKYFQDADRQDVDFDDYWEAIAAVRMHVYATRHIHPGVEYSYQVRSPQGPFQGTNEYEVPTVSKFSLIQAITLDKKMYSRPQLRLIYTRSVLNNSAVELFPIDDPRREDYDATTNRLVSHYGGVMVEWWFNNASLFRP